MTTTDYQKQAIDFLSRFNLTFQAEFVGKTCPPFATKTPHGKCPTCGDTHGWEWKITLSRGRRQLIFPFWNSFSDTHYEDGAKGWAEKRLASVERQALIRNGVAAGHGWALPPTAYDILACISSDHNCPETFEEWCAEFGYDTDSRRAEAVYRRCKDFAYKLIRFFTSEELAALSEIN